MLTCHFVLHADPENAVCDDDDTTLLIEENPPKGCWHWFTNCIGGMWATQTINETQDRETFVRTTIRELVVYSIFLLVLCTRKLKSIFSYFIVFEITTMKSRF